MKNKSFTIVTDTAAICIFDLACLKHRFDDADDWWSDPEEELEEVNKGNALIVGLPTDGSYHVEVSQSSGEDNLSHLHTAKLKSKSGTVFVGAAEDITAGQLEPSSDSDSATSGKFIKTGKGVFQVTLGIDSSNRIRVIFEESEGGCTNSFAEQILLFDD